MYVHISCLYTVYYIYYYIMVPNAYMKQEDIDETPLLSATTAEQLRVTPPPATWPYDCIHSLIILIIIISIYTIHIYIYVINY